MVLFFRIFLCQTVNDLAINFVIFGLAVLIGTLLVKSVEEEIALREELENSITGQKNLIHIMNHQIKGYLGKNKDIFAELLTDDYGKVPDTALPLLKTGLEQTNEGVDFVSQILRGASADNGALIYDMKKINLKDLLVKIFEEKKPAAEKKNLDISLKIDAGNYNTVGDEKQLGEAITNLIDNAINYTLSGSIRVELSEKYGRLILMIKDTGVGVKEEDKNKLFKAGGITKDSIKVNIKSSGYGLVFVKSVILAHKGMVWFESEGENQGTTFYVALPKGNK
jgi:two-component system sensor histidine kinase/response regulator